MPFEQPHQDQNELSLPANNTEKGPETVDVAAMAKERIAKADQDARKNSDSIRHADRIYVGLSSRVWTPEEKAEKEAEKKVDDTFHTTLYDTQKVISDRVRQYESLINADKLAWDKGSQKTGERNRSNTKKIRGSMFDPVDIEQYKVPEEELRVLQELYKLQKEVNAISMVTHKIDDLKKIRIRLALPELPQSLVSSKAIFDQSALDAAIQKDPTLSVDWEKIRAEFNQVETTLNRTETVLHILDTGVGIAAGLVPYGSEVYQLSRSMTHVLQGTMTPEDAARDFIVGVLASRVGGKVAEKLHVEQFVSTWVKKNAAYFSKKTAEQLARVTGKTLAGATQGGATGTADGAMSGTYNVLRGKQTVEQAVDETVNKVLIGMLFGGVTAGGMEAWKIRGEKLNEAQMQKMKNIIMKLPDADRPQAAAAILGKNLKDLSATQIRAVTKAHAVPMKDSKKYSPTELREKMDILEAGGFTRKEADSLLRMGVCGAPPPPPVPGKRINASSDADTPLIKQENQPESLSQAAKSFPFLTKRNRVTQLTDASSNQTAIIAWERSFKMSPQEVLMKKNSIGGQELEGVGGHRKPFDSESLFTQLQDKTHPDHALLGKFEEYLGDMLIKAQVKAKEIGIQSQLNGVLIENRANFEAGSGQMIKMPTEVVSLFVREMKTGNMQKLREYKTFLESRVVHEMTHKARARIDEEADEIATHALQFLSTEGTSKFLNSQLLEGVQGAAKGSTERYDVAQNASLKLIYLGLRAMPENGTFKQPTSYHPDDIAASFASMTPQQRALFNESIGKTIVEQKGADLLLRASVVPNIQPRSLLLDKQTFKSEPYYRDMNGRTLPQGTYTMERQNNRWMARRPDGSTVEALIDGMQVNLRTPGTSAYGTEIPAGKYTFTYSFDKTNCDYLPALRPQDNSTPYTVDFQKTKITQGMQ